MAAFEIEDQLDQDREKLQHSLFSVADTKSNLGEAKGLLRGMQDEEFWTKVGSSVGRSVGRSMKNFIGSVGFEREVMQRWVRQMEGSALRLEKWSGKVGKSGSITGGGGHSRWWEVAASKKLWQRTRT